MKRHKNCYTVQMVNDGSGEVPKAERAKPVFVQAWNYREAIEKAAGEVMACNQLHAKLRVTRLRRLRPVDHGLNPWRDLYVNREAVIRHIGAA